MSIRMRLALAFGLLVLIFAAVTGFVVYSSAVASLNAEIDRGLMTEADRFVRQLERGGDLRVPAGLAIQVVNADGSISTVAQLQADQAAAIAEQARAAKALADQQAKAKEQAAKDAQKQAVADALAAQRAKEQARLARLKAQQLARQQARDLARQQAQAAQPRPTLPRPRPTRRAGLGQTPQGGTAVRGSSVLIPTAVSPSARPSPSPTEPTQLDIPTLPSTTPLPVDAADVSLATGSTTGPLTRSVDIGSATWRVVTVADPAATAAVQVGRDITYVDAALASMRRQAVLAAAVAALLAIGAAWLLAGLLTSRLVRLTSAARDVARTGDIDTRVDEKGNDETAELASAFNHMLTALSAARAAERRLLEDAAHELRTPLTSLKTNAQVLPDFSRLDAAEQAALIAEIQDEANELIALVEQALVLDGPVGTLTLASVNLATVANSAARSAARSGVDITVNGEATVVGDARQLRRAIANLVSNATKYAPGTPIRITLDADRTWARITVSDGGPGFPADSTHRVFDRFWRGGEHRSVSGSGLGLSIVSDVASRHGGHVTAANSPSGGATVTITLPVEHSLS